MIDLHCHTTCSDGTLSPPELLDHAIGAGVTLLSVTDHDTIDAWARICGPARERGIRLLCGVELSTHLPGCTRSVHLLGYFPVRPDPDFCAWLAGLRQTRVRRNAALLARLQELGLDLRWDEVTALAQSQVGRPHFAAVLLAKGYVRTLQEAFDEYLGEGARAWVGRDEPHLADALHQVVAAGGLSSLAHPVRVSRDQAELDRIVAASAARGLQALECFHSEHSPDDTAQLLVLADKYDLAVTGGSDFHGATKPGVELVSGRGHVPLVPEWVAAQLLPRFADVRNQGYRSPTA